MEIKKRAQILADYTRYLKGDDTGLVEAYNKARQGSLDYPASIELQLMSAFLAMKARKKDIALGILEKLKPYMSFYKTHGPQIYATYHVLLAELDPKHFKKSEANIAMVRDKGYFFDLLFAHLYEKTDRGQVYEHLEKAYVKGCRSPFLYFAFLKVFAHGRRGYQSEFALGFLKWALSKGLLTRELLDLNAVFIKTIMTKHLALFKQIYKEIKLNWLLIEICKVQFFAGDMSMSAYVFYKELERKQVYHEEFNRALIRAAYENKIENISRFSLERFLTHKDQEMSRLIQPYLCHLILTRDNLTDLVELYGLKAVLINLALSGVGGDMLKGEDRYYSSIYRYALANMDETTKEAQAKAVTDMELFLANHLFKYQVRVKDPEIQYIWVSEVTKLEPKIYELIEGAAEIELASEDYRLLCLDNDKKSIIEEIPVLTQMVSKDMWLYTYLYERGHKGFDMLLAKTIHYLETEDETHEALEVLTKFITNKGIARGFRMRIYGRLGRIHHRLGQGEKALECYQKVETKSLSDEDLTKLVGLLMAAKAYDVLTQTLAIEHTRVALPVLEAGIQTLLGLSDHQKQRYLPQVMPVLLAWALSEKGDQALLEVVSQHYEGPLDTWCQLAAKDETGAIQFKVLEEAVAMQVFTSSVQALFAQVYETHGHGKVVDAFIYYVCYQVLKKDQLLSPEVQTIIESVYQEKKSPLLLLTLGKLSVYAKAKNDILQETLAYAKAQEVFLPFLMAVGADQLDDQQNKLWAVEYEGEKGSEVTLHYRSQGEETFMAVPMSYFIFGMYVAAVPLFYHETIEYYFTEGQVATEVATYTNTKLNLRPEAEDPFYQINNGIVYYEMFKYDELEKTVQEMIVPKAPLFLKAL